MCELYVICIGALQTGVNVLFSSTSVGSHPGRLISVVKTEAVYHIKRGGGGGGGDTAEGRRDVDQTNKYCPAAENRQMH